MVRAVLLPLLLALCYPCSSLPELRYRDIFLKKQQESLDASTTTNTEDVEELYLTQRLDHLDATNSATFQQRYFQSFRYHKEAIGPTINFLCVGGEGPGFDKSVLVDSVHCTGDMLELAKRLSSHYNVHLYALEHRYYGKSYPTFDDGTSPLETANLKYLSSQQALEDLAHFVNKMNQQTDDSTSNIWVTFGGSYPGMMALYARYKYPHLIQAAVSSSAPINAKADFPEYKARQGWDLMYEKVGGSSECHRIVKTGHEQAVTLLQTSTDTTNGPVELATMFNLCDPSTTLNEKRNQELLLGDGLINIPAQSNDPSCTFDEMCNIGGLCNVLIKEFQSLKDSLEYPELHVLAKVSEKQQFSAKGGDITSSCMPVDFEAMLEEVTKTEVDDFGWRSWLYQTCSEFGFYQTCGDDCPFASHFHQIDMDLEICEKAFGITNVYQNVQATRDRYGGLDIVNTDATNILSVNGNVDPWSMLALGKANEQKYSMPVKEVDGASHHFWTHPVKESDTDEVVQAREYIHSVVMDWLGVEAFDAPLQENIGHQSSSIHRRTRISRG